MSSDKSWEFVRWLKLLFLWIRITIGDLVTCSSHEGRNSYKILHHFIPDVCHGKIRPKRKKKRETEAEEEQVFDDRMRGKWNSCFGCLIIKCSLLLLYFIFPCSLGFQEAGGEKYLAQMLFSIWTLELSALPMHLFSVDNISINETLIERHRGKDD